MKCEAQSYCSGRNGNIFVKNPERFGLEPGIEQSGDYDGFPISVFHQLHCLVGASPDLRCALCPLTYANKESPARGSCRVVAWF